MIGIKLAILSQDNVLLGVRYEMMHVMEGINLSKTPIFQDYHEFSIGIIFFTVSIMITSGEEYIREP